MNIRLEARFLVRVGETVTVACFRHAVRWAMAGCSVEMEIDDFTSEQDGRSRLCQYCEADSRQKTTRIGKTICGVCTTYLNAGNYVCGHTDADQR